MRTSSIYVKNVRRGEQRRVITSDVLCCLSLTLITGADEPIAVAHKGKEPSTWQRTSTKSSMH